MSEYKTISAYFLSALAVELNEAASSGYEMIQIEKTISGSGQVTWFALLRRKP